MLIKQDGNLQKGHYTQTMWHFSNILSCFIDHVFLLIMSMFFGKYCIFMYILHFENNNTMLHFLCISLQCLLLMERFVCNLHAYSAYLQYMEDTGRSKMCQEFWSLGISGLNK